MAIENITERDLNRLMEHTSEWCASMYMSMRRAGPLTRENPIRFKNLVSELEERLRRNGLSGSKLKKFMAPLNALGDGEFRGERSSGLAVFLSDEFMESYLVPLEFDELVVVNERFHLKPLLPLFSDNGRFYALCLSQNSVRFIEGTKYTVKEIHLKDMPGSLSEALWADDPEKQLQQHTDMPPVSGGYPGTTYHGQGVGKDDKKERIQRFLRKVSEVAEDYLKDGRDPLVIAAAEPLLSIYPEVSSYRYLVEDGVHGNPEDSSMKDLHAKVWKAVEGEFRKKQEEEKARYGQLVESGSASSDTRKVVRAACAGRIGSLFVSLGSYVWGRCSPDTFDVIIHDKRVPGDEDLVDLAAIKTITQGGAVYAVEGAQAPDNAPMAAIFRY